MSSANAAAQINSCNELIRQLNAKIQIVTNQIADLASLVSKQATFLEIYDDDVKEKKQKVAGIEEVYAHAKSGKTYGNGMYADLTDADYVTRQNDAYATLDTAQEQLRRKREELQSLQADLATQRASAGYWQGQYNYWISEEARQAAEAATAAAKKSKATKY